MPSSNAINPFNYNIDSFDSGFLGPITDTNFRTYLFTHNLGQPNPIISGVISNPWASLGTEYDVSQSSFNVADVPNLGDVAQIPSVYNNLTNPRQVNIGSNLPNINPQIVPVIGQTNPAQAGQGVDSATQINQNPSNVDVPGLQTVANTPSVYNNLTNPRQVNLAGNLTTIDPAIQSSIGQSTPIQAGQGIDATLLFNTNVANIDVPSPTIVAQTPSPYNNQTNPRQVNISSNLPNINPEIQTTLGLTTLSQAGQGIDAVTLFNPNASNLDLPSLSDAAQNSSNINNFTNPRQDNLDMNPTLTDLTNWYPQEFDVILAAKAGDYNTSYGIPQTLQIGFVGNIEAWVEPSGVVTPSLLYSLQNIINVSNNKWGPSNLNVQTWVNDGLQESTLVSQTGLIEYKVETSGLLSNLFETANNFQSQITGISLANPIQLGVGIIPFSDIGSGINFKPDGQNETDLAKIASKRRLTEIANRVISNAIDDTIGRFSFLERPFATLAGGSFYEKNYIITSRKGTVGELIQGAASLVGLNAIGTNGITGPDIPDGAFNGTNDIGPSFGENLALDKGNWDISEGILDRTGDATRSLLFEALNRNKYLPRTQKKQGFANTDIFSPLPRKVQKNYLTYDNDLNLSEDVGESIDDLLSGNELTRREKRKLKRAEKKASKEDAKLKDVEYPTEFKKPTANETPAYGGFFGNNQAGDIDISTYSDNAGFRPELDANETIKKPSTTWQGDNPNQAYPTSQTTHEGFDWRARDPSVFKKGLLQYTQFIINQASTGTDDYVPSPKAKVSAQKMVNEPAGYIGYFDSDVSFKRKQKTVTTTETVVVEPERTVFPDTGEGTIESEDRAVAAITIPAVTETRQVTKVVDEDLDPENSAHITGVETLEKWPTLPSKGNQVRNATIKVKKDSDGKKTFAGVEGGDVYCRSWTSRRKYHKRSNLVRHEGNWWKIPKESEKLMTMNHPSQQNGSPKIAWDSYDKAQFKNLNPSQDLNKIKGVVIPYMFSIENLAWKDAPQKQNLPPCEIGPNGGRIMWFPPYDINFSDNTSVSWDKTDFIGRGEAIYTYNNTERSGNLSWTIVVDHPEVLNSMRDIFKNKLSKIVADGTINSYFAGCADIKELFEAVIPEPFKIPEPEPCNDCNRPVTNPGEPPFTAFQVFFDNAKKCTGEWSRPLGKVKIAGVDVPTCEAGKTCHGRVVNWDYETKYTNIQGYFANKIELSTSVTAGVSDSSNTCISKYSGTTNSTVTRGTGFNTAEGFYFAGFEKGEKNGFTFAEGMNNNLKDLRLKEKIWSGKAKLEEVADFLLTPDGKNYKIVVEGHTSPSQVTDQTEGDTFSNCGLTKGDVTYNQQLARNRAQSLMKELIELLLKKETQEVIEPISGKSYYKESEVFDIIDKVDSGTNRGDSNNQIFSRWARVNKASANPVPCTNEVWNPDDNGDSQGNVGLDTAPSKCKKNGEDPNTTQKGPFDGPPPVPLPPGVVSIKDLFGDCSMSTTGDGKKYGCFDGNPCMNLFATQNNSVAAKQSRKAVIRLEPNLSFQQKLIDQKNKEAQAENDKKNAAKLAKAEAEYKQLVDRLAVNYVNECDYFMKMEQDAPFIYNNLMDKIQNFHPAFHAITPEGFNSRLTFLQQCTRQGPQMINDDLPNNMVFGRPPICVLRIGDFYHTKIIIDSINFTFEPLQWDLNPEGIGVQPMLAKVDMGFKFIGGSSLGGPIQQLQNAVTYNFFANTGVYRPIEEVKGAMDNKKKVLYGAFLTPEEELKYYGSFTEKSVEEKVKTEAEAKTETVASDKVVKAEGEKQDPNAIKGGSNTNTGQADKKSATSNPNEKKIPISFVSNNVDDAHNFDKNASIESKVVAAMEELYKNGINPVVKKITITILDRQNGPFTDRYKTTGEIIVGDNGKGNPAYLGFTTRGSIGSADCAGNRAYAQRWLQKGYSVPCNPTTCSGSDCGKTLEDRLREQAQAVDFKDVDCGGAETPPSGLQQKGVKPLAIDVVTSSGASAGIKLVQYFVMFTKLGKDPIK